MSDRSDSFCRGQLSRTGSAASRAGCFVVTVALLFGLSARAEPKRTSVGAATPWPQVLPCAVFSTVQFEVYVRADSSGNAVPMPVDVQWGTAAGPTQTFRSDAQRPFVGNPLAAGFPSAEPPQLAVPAAADWTQLNILLRCAGPTRLGIEWRCPSRQPCVVQVGYPDEGPSWPDFVERSDEDLLQTKPGPVAVTRKLRHRTKALAAAAAGWVDAACRGGRCSSAIAAARSQLDRFLQATPTLQATQINKRQDSCHHGFQEYQQLAVKLTAGGERVSIHMDWEYGWQIAFGTGAHRLHCTSAGCRMEREGSLGEPVSMTELEGFLIKAEALAMRPYVSASRQPSPWF